MGNEKEVEELKIMIKTQFEKYDNLSVKVIEHDKDIEFINKDFKEFRDDAKGSLRDITKEISKIREFIIDQIGELYEHVKNEIKGVQKKYDKIVWMGLGGLFASLVTIILLLINIIRG